MQFAALEDDEVVELLKVIGNHPKKYKLAPNNCLFLFVNVPRNPDAEAQVEFLTELISLIDPLIEAVGT